MKKLFIAIAGLYLLVLSLVSMASECSAKSGVKVASLLELYTSEGCSSCPPADQWFSSLKEDNSFNKTIVPLAFHVDYWDYIGWKDQYASNQFTNRQNWIAQVNQLHSIYTPQSILNGKDFRGWRQSGSLQEALNEKNRPARANISINNQLLNNAELKVNVEAKVLKNTDASNVDIFIAVYENNLKSMVKAGENNGKELKHDFVVRTLFGPFKLEANGNFKKVFNLSKAWQSRDGGVASFMQDRETGDVLQALKLPFCSS